MAPLVFSVFGATGTQGASVVNAILADGTFQARAFTRNPSSKASQELKRRGAEVVKGDMGSDRASLVDALRGSKAVFLVTVPVFDGASTSEKDQGINVIEASKEAGVEFLVFSYLPSVIEASNGRYKAVSHYEDKAALKDYLKTAGLPYAMIQTGFFLENFWNHHSLNKVDGGLELSVPVPGDVADIFTWVSRDVGVVSHAVARAYVSGNSSVVGKLFPVINAFTDFNTIAERMSKALGVPVKYSEKPRPGIPPLDEMFAAHSEFTAGLLPDTTLPNPDLVALGVKLGTVEEFLEAEVRGRFGI